MKNWNIWSIWHIKKNVKRENIKNIGAFELIQMKHLLKLTECATDMMVNGIFGGFSKFSGGGQ